MGFDYNFIFKDIKYECKNDMPYIDKFVIKCKDEKINGYVLVPGKYYNEKRPCIIFFHGFPGYVTNNDIEHALRRGGCVVVHIYHRGSWGSEGKYLFSGLIEDGNGILDFICEDKNIKKYNINRENIYVAGHSMGGMTAINIAAQRKEVKGGIFISPYDFFGVFDGNSEGMLRQLIEDESKCLNIEDKEVLFENAKENMEKQGLKNNIENLHGKKCLFIGAAFDEITPPEKMLRPYFIKEKNKKHEYYELNGDHSFCSNRIQLTEMIGKWLDKVVNVNVNRKEENYEKYN